MPGPYNSYVDIMGGTPVNPANSSFQAIDLTSDNSPYVMVWPVTGATSGQIVTNLINVNADEDGLFIQMPDATEMSVGLVVLFCNKGENDFSIVDADGELIALVPVADGEVDPSTSGCAFIYLTDNTTEAGTWDVVAWGALTGAVQASLLAGLGLVADATNGTLNTNMVVKPVAGPTYNVLPSILNPNMSDRAKYIIWTGGSGNIIFPRVSDATAGFYFMVGNNTSAGASITLSTTDGAHIDGQTTQILTLSQTAIYATDGTNWYSLGLGTPDFFQPSAATLDLSPYAGAGVHVLTPSEASKTIVNLITASTPLTANLTLLWPQTPGFYIISNNITSTSFSLNIAANGGTIVNPLPNGATYIFYNDGFDMQYAPTGTPSGSIIFPNGSAGTPSIRFVNSPSDGFFSLASGKIGASIAGTEVFEWDASGVTIAPPGAINTPALNFSSIPSLGGGAYIDTTNHWIHWVYGGIDSVVMGQNYLGIGNGLQNLPSLGPTSERNSGLYRPGSGQLAFSILGTQIALFDATGISTLNGTAGAPSYSYLTSAVDGMYLAGSHINGFSCNSVLTATVEPEGIKTINGTFSNPSYSFLNFPDTGISVATGNIMSFISNNTEVFSIDPTHLVLGSNMELVFLNPAGTFATSFISGISTLDTTYTLPINYPTNSGSALISSNAGVMGWSNSVFTANGITLPNGTITNPSLIFQGSANGGMYYDTGANQIAFSMGGVSPVKIDSSKLTVDGSLLLSGGSTLFFNNGANTFAQSFSAPSALAINQNIIWPSNTPTVGNTLRVLSVTGSPPNITVTLQWAV